MPSLEASMPQIVTIYFADRSPPALAYSAGRAAYAPGPYPHDLLPDLALISYPPDNPGVSEHPRACIRILILHRLWGMPIGEFFDLEDLAEACAAANQYTFFFSSWPLNVYEPF